MRDDKACHAFPAYGPEGSDSLECQKDWRAKNPGYPGMDPPEHACPDGFRIRKERAAAKDEAVDVAKRQNCTKPTQCKKGSYSAGKPRKFVLRRSCRNHPPLHFRKRFQKIIFERLVAEVSDTVIAHEKKPHGHTIATRREAGILPCITRVAAFVEATAARKDPLLMLCFLFSPPPAFLPLSEQFLPLLRRRQVPAGPRCRIPHPS